MLLFRDTRSLQKFDAVLSMDEPCAHPPRIGAKGAAGRSHFNIERHIKEGDRFTKNRQIALAERRRLGTIFMACQKTETRQRFPRPPA